MNNLGGWLDPRKLADPDLIVPVNKVKACRNLSFHKEEFTQNKNINPGGQITCIRTVISQSPYTV
jgi:hypothetical protein